MHLIEAFMAHCVQRNLRPSYIYHSRLALQRLARRCDLLTATHDDLVAYLASRTHSPSSRAVEIAYLRGFYRWVLDEGLLTEDPTRRLIRPRTHAGLPRPMPDDDIARALAEAPCQVAPILNLAVYAGLRSCEIAQLRAEDIGTDVIIIRESKGGGESVVPLSPLLAGILERCPLPRSGWLFPGRNGHLSRSRIGQLANRYLHSIGIEHTLHTLRHAYGTAVYRTTRDLRLTQELLRHRSIQSTVGYTKLVPDAGRDAVSGLQW